MTPEVPVGTSLAPLQQARAITVVLAKGYCALRLHDHSDVIFGLSMMTPMQLRTLIIVLENAMARLERGDAPELPERVQ